jgi:hypothetical protein
MSAADHALPKVPPIYRIAPIYNWTVVASPRRHHAAARLSGVSTPLASARIIQVKPTSRPQSPHGCSPEVVAPVCGEFERAFPGELVEPGVIPWRQTPR